MFDREAMGGDGHIKEAKDRFSKVGYVLAISIFVVVGLSYALYFGMPAIVGKDSPIVKSPLWFWFVSFVPLYIVAFPITQLIFRRMDKTAIPKKKLSMLRFLTFLLICFPVMTGGSILGNILGNLISGGKGQNSIEGIVLDNSIMKVIVVVILAPIVEEIIFRKSIIDHTVKYGEKMAVILSGVTFGLYHMNIFQLFYAFGLGVLFAYVYVITGKVIYPIILHMVINFQGGVIVPWVMSKANLDIDTLRKMSDSDLVNAVLKDSGTLYLIIYSLVVFSLIVAGAIALAINKDKFTFVKTQSQLPEDKQLVFSTVYLNWGMSLFVVICLVRTIYALI